MTDLTFANFDVTYGSTTPRFDSLLEAVNTFSRRSIDSLDEIDLQPVSGGDINEASLLTISNSDQQNQQFFLKQNSLEKAPVLFAEVEGLAAIHAAGARTCQPLAVGVDNERARSFLLLSVIRPVQGSNTSTKKGWEDLALQLATLHQAMAPQPHSVQNNTQKSATQTYTTPENTTSSQASHSNKSDVNQGTRWYAGWFNDNYIGSSPQHNRWTVNWHEFFATQRVGVQCKMAFDNQLIDRQTVQQIERIQHKLEHYLPNYPLTDETGQPRPSLLHGDLWAGNAMLGQAAADNKNSDAVLGYLIDPAVYIGHPETDLALTQLFGGFTSEFYDAYLAHGIVEDGFAERVDLYNLYHYLNHLNLFGDSYLSAVQRIAQRFGS